MKGSKYLLHFLVLISLVGWVILVSCAPQKVEPGIFTRSVPEMKDPQD